MKFINLHQHTTYSFLDGFGQPKQYIEALNTVNQEAMAITDHGNIYSHVPFSSEFEKAGKHLIYGVELYCVEELSNARLYYHMTVLAKTNEGYQNLLKIVNLSYQEDHFYYKPRITFEEILKYNKGLILLSGCCCDSYLVKQKDEDKVKQWLWKFRNTEFYLELQPFKNEQEHWDKLVKYAEGHNDACLITLDGHYPKKEDKDTHDFQLAINTRRPLADPDRLKMEYPLHLCTAEEVIKRCEEMGNFKEIWIAGTYRVAMECKVKLPKTEMMKLGITVQQLREKCMERMVTYGLDKKKEYAERLEYELKLIEEKGFNDYFWIIQDMVNWAKERMLVGAGRGSSAGSLVCWMLGINEVDPIKYGLYFERFIDLQRGGWVYTDSFIGFQEYPIKEFRKENV